MRQDATRHPLARDTTSVDGAASAPPADALFADAVRTIDARVARRGVLWGRYPFGPGVPDAVVREVGERLAAHYRARGTPGRMDFAPAALDIKAEFRLSSADMGGGLRT